MPEAGTGKLDEQQLAAIEHEDGPLEVIAGPGAGKTFVLVERAARLYERGVPLTGMVLVTFTTRAAGEMRERLQLRLGMDVSDRTLRNVSTIHALAYRILRAAKKRKGQPGWRVADENEAFDALRQAMAELNVPRELYSPGMLARQIEAIQGLPAEAAAVFDETVTAVYQRYRQILTKARRWDLGELVPGAFRALRDDEEMGSLFRRLCVHLMVDEWQDVSLLEYEFLKGLLDGDNIFVVGSPAQSIYEWRRAHYESLAARFRDDFPHLQTIVLQRNHRSTRQILKAATSLVSNGYAEAGLEPVKGDGPPVQVHVAYDPDAEADLVAYLLLRYHEQEGLGYQDMAVLFREWRQVAAIEQALASRAIPYNLGDRLQQALNGAATSNTLHLNAGFTQVLAHGRNSYLYGVGRIGEGQPGGWQYHLGDALASVRQIVDPAGAVLLTRTYEPFGTLLTADGTAATPYGFTGEWSDGTGLLYLRG